jgi:hypothetical protein
VADEGDGLGVAIEAPHQVEDVVVSAQLVGGVAAGDHERVVVLGMHVVGRSVDLDRSVPLLAGHGPTGQAGDGDVELLLAQSVERVQQLHVLEFVGGEDEHSGLASHDFSPLTGSG